MESTTVSQKEFRLQLAVIEHLDGCFKGQLEYFHVPNRPGNATDGHFKKVMGAKAGVADLVIGWRNGNAMVELKAPDGIFRSDQNKFMSCWAFLGWKTAVCKSVREVHDALVSWGLKPAYNTCIEPDYSSKQEKKQDGHAFFAPVEK